MVAALRAFGRSAEVVVRTISRGGALLDCDWPLAAGAPLEIELRGAGGSVTGRVVRCGKGGLAVVFSSDPAALARIDGALDTFAPQRAAA